ncbi:hypothetical protein PM082_010433 [Marasmius tenuissimus]|nr:hypothetical protein PM082_010433 [Marasmius tenuissimus]
MLDDGLLTQPVTGRPFGKPPESGNDPGKAAKNEGYDESQKEDVDMAYQSLRVELWPRSPHSSNVGKSNHVREGRVKGRKRRRDEEEEDDNCHEGRVPYMTGLYTKGKDYTQGFLYG